MLFFIYLQAQWTLTELKFTNFSKLTSFSNYKLIIEYYKNSNFTKLIAVIDLKMRYKLYSLDYPSIILFTQISWMKRDEKNNLKLLTYGLDTYSSDSRQSLRFESPNDWQLRLKAVQRSDAGSYQCQMSTHPPRILHYTLNVVGKWLP